MAPRMARAGASFLVIPPQKSAPPSGQRQVSGRLSLPHHFCTRTPRQGSCTSLSQRAEMAYRAKLLASLSAGPLAAFGRGGRRRTRHKTLKAAQKPHHRRPLRSADSVRAARGTSARAFAGACMSHSGVTAFAAQKVSAAVKNRLESRRRAAMPSAGVASRLRDGRRQRAQSRVTRRPGACDGRPIPSNQSSGHPRGGCLAPGRARLPAGGGLEHADELTLIRALQGRRDF